MGSLQLNSSHLASFSLTPSFSHRSRTRRAHLRPFRSQTSFSRSRIRAVGTVPESGSETAAAEEPPCVNFAFVSSVLLPDGTPDVHLRTACGGQKLRDIMLDSDVELYGPYARPLLNCAGGGTCATCLVEVVQGKELLSPLTDKEKEKLKKKPKNYRLACQTTVGKPDSRGLVVIQQLPEWKAHEWKFEKVSPSESL
ncbi:photosynthetic NDH subunit of subcomplex B 3, chloroplastic [Eucalyptus grandis]|uniref:photosynthetic NDH subunit of subcomplex B 3, chloroplastic n=1 Tax=Eucalyptus grandis TaxID=71139 RepID=UPI00192F024B|nr:photosynthetic NDH subunit of subcomplex B 3, chloroplastic [Eucalyptus grandis]